MEITERMSNMRDQLHQRRLEGKRDDAEQENQRLKIESRMLRDELEEDRSELSKLLSALEDGRLSASPSRHRLRRLMSLTLAAGGAYLLGARAGRERYEEIRARCNDWMRTGRSTAANVRSRADGAVEEAKVTTERVADATAVVGETARSVLEGPSSAKGAGA